MYAEKFFIENYDLVYALKMIDAQREQVLQGDYDLFDSENKFAHYDQLNSLQAMNILVIDKVLNNIRKYQNYLDNENG